MLKFQKIAPPHKLAAIVDFYYFVENTSFVTTSFLVNHPQGTIDMMFALDGEFTFKKKNCKIIQRAASIGQQSDYFEFEFSAHSRTIGFALKADAYDRLGLVQASDLVDSSLDINLLGESQVSELHRKLQDESNLLNQIELINTFLLKRLSQSSLGQVSWRQLVEDIHSENGLMDITYLSNQANMSERNFRRRFKQVIGISPKKYVSIVRFNAALKQFKQRPEPANVQDIVYDLEYYDQNHFIKTFKKFTGNTPNNYLQDNPILPFLFKEQVAEHTF